MKIKICGLFREEDIAYVNEARPDYSGFVFAESRRKVSPAQAAKLRRLLAGGIIPVGVFVNAPVESICALYRDGVIGMAQLHGGENEEYIARLKEASGGIPVIQVIKSTSFKSLTQRRKDTKELAEFSEHAQNSVVNSSFPPCSPWLVNSTADYYLLDSGAGSGKAFDWGLLNPLDIEKPWFLAGGINIENIKNAMALNPFAIDVSSGAETEGIKDREKIVQLTAMVKTAMVTEG